MKISVKVPLLTRARADVRPQAYVRSWPFLPVNEGFNGAQSYFRFVPESGRSLLGWLPAECRKTTLSPVLVSMRGRKAPDDSYYEEG